MIFGKRKTHLVTEPFQSRVMESGKMLLSMGSEVSFETVHAQRGATVRQSIVETAKEFLNVPYLWGGKSFLESIVPIYTASVKST